MLPSRCDLNDNQTNRDYLALIREHKWRKFARTIYFVSLAFTVGMLLWNAYNSTTIIGKLATIEKHCERIK